MEPEDESWILVEGSLITIAAGESDRGITESISSRVQDAIERAGSRGDDTIGAWIVDREVIEWRIDARWKFRRIDSCTGDDDGIDFIGARITIETRKMDSIIA